MLSLVCAGVSPLYYITTSVSAPGEPAVSQESANPVGGEQNASQGKAYDTNSSVTVRLTLNPFVAETSVANAKRFDVGPLENDGGMKSSAPHSSPVVLWLVSASASGTVASSHWTRTYHLEKSRGTLQRSSAVSFIPTGAIHAEHPKQRLAATLLGQKPSGVS